MKEDNYRGQLIRIVATETPGTEYWAAKSDIRWQDREGVRFVPLKGPRNKFTIREFAELNIIKEAEKRIDSLIKSKS